MLFTTDAYYAAALSTAKKYCKKMQREKSGFSQTRRNGQYCHRWLYYVKTNIISKKILPPVRLNWRPLHFNLMLPTELIN